jgi:hypothetical protein
MKKIFVVIMLLGSNVLTAQEMAFTSSERTHVNVGFLKTDKRQAKNISPLLPGQRMRNAGRTLTLCGSAMFLGGVILMNNADALYYTSTQTQYGTVNEGDPKGALGVLMTVGGVGMVIPGIILWSKGHKKYNRFLERQSVTMHTVPSGLSVKYSF